MLSPRHGPEQAFTDDLDAFADVLEPLASHPRAGTRQWSVHELGVLRRGRSLPVLVHAAHDQITEVREAARAAIDTLAQLHSDAADALADFDD
jgi:hypothetical protein